MPLQHAILLHPRYFGPQLNNVIKEKLYREVEGTCLGSHGYVITITSIDNIGPGKLYSEGMACYDVKYRAIIFRPFKGEVLEAIVKQVSKVGIFVEIGALTCFINRHSIPSHYTFQAAIPMCYKSEGDEAVICIEEKIRVKIIGVRMDMNGLFAIGTLMDDYLGVIDS